MENKENRRCDNVNCRFRFEELCIHSGYSLIGIEKCSDYIITHESPEEIYKNLLEGSESNCGNSNNSQK